MSTVTWVPPVFDLEGFLVAPDVMWFEGKEDEYYTISSWNGSKATLSKEPLAFEDLHPIQQEAVMDGSGGAPPREMMVLLLDDPEEL